MYRIFLASACLFFQVTILMAKETSLISCQSQLFEATDYKIYLKQSQIHFFDNKIFVEIDHNLFEVNSLITDNEGIYCGIRVEGYPYSWDCPKCGTHNTDRNYCSVCCYWPSGGK